MDNNSELSEIRYFVDGKLVLAIESTELWGTDGAYRRNDLQEILPEFIADRLGLDGAELDYIAIFDLQTLGLYDSEYLRPDDLSAVTALAFVTVEGLGDEALIETIVDLQAGIQEGGGIVLNDDPYLVLTAVSPDWLAATAAEQDGTGGPGGRPVAWLEHEGIPSIDWVPDEDFMECSNNLNEVLHSVCQREVDVAILDTAPSQRVLQDAYQHWGSGSKGKEHRLVEALLASDRLTFDANELDNGAKLWVCHANAANYPDNPQMPQLNSPLRYGHVVDHEYRMPDHGLFIAGIIHTIVSEARLYLIQVINDWGMCSISSIIAGLEKLAEVRAGRSSSIPLVINLSLVLGLPRHEAHRGRNPKKVPGWPETPSAQESFLVEMSGLLKKVTDLLSGTPNSIIVAAAGNDRKSRLEIPKARYPAAFKKVTGVGALDSISLKTDKDNHNVEAEYASYSNEADDPENKGFATFGGKIDPGSPPDHAETDKDSGVRGIYIGDFPDGTLNHTGWARWAGTSFATPVIAGLIAELLCVNEQLRPADAENELRQLVKEASIDDAEIVPMHQPS
jgi:hypothetical protein